MNLLEAIKSGRHFRRTGDTDWLRYDKKDERCFTPQGTVRVFHWGQDILADDWEIQEQKVAITRARLEKALRACSATSENFIAAVACELGLGEEPLTFIPIPNVQRCRTCGRALDDGYVVCPDCGYPL